MIPSTKGEGWTAAQLFSMDKRMLLWLSLEVLSSGKSVLVSSRGCSAPTSPRRSLPYLKNKKGFFPRPQVSILLTLNKDNTRGSKAWWLLGGLESNSCAFIVSKPNYLADASARHWATQWKERVPVRVLWDADTIEQIGRSWPLLQFNHPGTQFPHL
jgi:hypothetical protein